METLKKVLKFLVAPFLALLGIYLLLTKTKDQRKEQTLAKEEALRLAQEEIDKKIKAAEENLNNIRDLNPEEREKYWQDHFKNNPGAQRND